MALLLVNVCLATVVAAELASRAALLAIERWLPDPRVQADVYAGSGWAADYYREFRESGDVAWQPYVYWRRLPYAGRFINVDEHGVRRTWRAPGAGGGPLVFVFGDSTVWGSGARDEYTLPSELAKAMAAAGVEARVVNLGESGYVTAQSVALLLSSLRRGEIPDLAVFYGGIEDVFSAYQSGTPGLPTNEDNRRLEFNATRPDGLPQVLRMLTTGLNGVAAFVRRRSERTAGAAPAWDAASLAAAAVDDFCRTARSATGLGAEFGFPVRFYWQPVVFGKPLQTAYEEAEAGRYAGARPLFESAYARMAAAEPCPAAPVTYLGDLFADTAAPLYVDALHLSEDGHRLVAAAIVPELLDALSAPRK
ncbi:MAG: SGNH/GDSL hydrolase family protein [Vicinamibacterales bacterium]